MDDKSSEELQNLAGNSELIKQMIDVQQRELEVRAKIAENERAMIESNREVASSSIKASLESDKIHAEAFLAFARGRNRVIVVCVLLLTVFLSLCVILRETDIAFELIKYIGVGALAYFAGFNHGQNRHPNSKPNQK